MKQIKLFAMTVLISGLFPLAVQANEEKSGPSADANPKPVVQVFAISSEQAERLIQERAKHKKERERLIAQHKRSVESIMESF